MSETVCNQEMNTEIPKWYGDLRVWREEHGCVGGLWDVYAGAAEERVRMVKTFFVGLGFLGGFIVGAIVFYYMGIQK